MKAASAPARVVVTGATGIAASTALRLAEFGTHVFVISSVEQECADLIERLGDRGAGCAVADLRDEGAAERAFAAARENLTAVQGVVAVAGGSGRAFGDGPLHGISLEGWEATLRLNLTTAFLTAREAIRCFRTSGSGSLVLTSSVLAWSPSARHFSTHAYAAAKAAIAGLAISLASTYAAEGIRVNAIAPGLVRTPMSRRAAGDDEILAFARSKQPTAPGLLDPDDVADAIVWALRSPQLTGQVVAIDGGWTVSEGSAT